MHALRDEKARILDAQGLITEGEAMKLTEEPQVVTWPQKHYVFVEKVGPFQTNAPQAWQNLHAFIPTIAEHNQITGYVSLYKMGPKIYRAGVTVAAHPAVLPEGLGYTQFSGGKFSRFVLTGSYSNLGPATGRVMQIISETKLPLRDDYFIENYLNDPRTTPEAELITEILVPTV
jgi:effector-binding domain-containing protein